MTYKETAAAMRRLADAMDKVTAMRGRDEETGRPIPMLDGEAAVGGAAVLCLIRDFITLSIEAGGRSMDTPSMLVLLESLSRDQQIFPCGVGVAMWNAVDEEEGAV